MITKILLTASVLINIYLAYFIAKRYYYSRIPPIIWKYDIAMLGDSHIYRANWNKLLNCRVANFGKGGSTVKDMYERLPGVINCRPKICLVNGGINDIVTNGNLDSTVHYYEKIYYDLKRNNIRPVFMEVMKTRDGKYDVLTDSLNSQLRAIGETISAPIVDDDLQADGVHLNGSGYYKWAGVIKLVRLFD